MCNCSLYCVVQGAARQFCLRLYLIYALTYCLWGHDTTSQVSPSHWNGHAPSVFLHIKVLIDPRMLSSRKYEYFNVIYEPRVWFCIKVTTDCRCHFPILATTIQKSSAELSANFLLTTTWMKISRIRFHLVFENHRCNSCFTPSSYSCCQVLDLEVRYGFIPSFVRSI